MYLMNKKQQKTDKKLVFFAEAPLAGAWIEIYLLYLLKSIFLKPLSQGRELKLYASLPPNSVYSKPLSQGRELKLSIQHQYIFSIFEAPLAGAWIEIRIKKK